MPGLRALPTLLALLSLAAAPVAAPAAKAADVADWGMELKLEEIEVDQPPEDPGRQGI